MSRLFPDPVLSERLLIRTPLAQDAAGLYEALAETWPQLKVWMPWAIGEPNLDEARAVCARMESQARAGEDFPTFCFDRESGRFVMASGLHPRETSVPSYMIGYWCRTSCQGRGYVQEVVRRLTDVGFEDLAARRIEIFCDERNAASRAVAEKCGYRLEGIRVNDSRDTSGVLSSTAVYALTRDD